MWETKTNSFGDQRNMYPPWEGLTVSSRYTCTLLYSVASIYLGRSDLNYNASFSRLGGVVAVEIIGSLSMQRF